MGWLEAGRLDSIARKSVIKSEVAGVQIALYRLADDAVYATHGICTHALAFLAEGFVSDGTIECPLHQGVFDIRSGKALCAPLTRDIPTFLVKVEDGIIYVDLDQPARVAPATSTKATGEPTVSSATKVVIIGAGQAAAAAVRGLRQSGFLGTIALVGEERHLPYERPPLSKDILLGKADLSASFRLQQSETEAFGVDLHLGRRALKIDNAARNVLLDDGTVLPYDALLIATGGKPRRLEVPGGELAGVLYLRTIEDALAINKAIASAKRVAIVGGGFIGLEIASATTALGVPCVVLEREPEIMARILPSALGRSFRCLAQSKGIEVKTGTAVEAIARGQGGLVISTTEGAITADAVIVGVGLEVNTELAASAGCDVEAGGIVTDAEGRTSVPGIWAAGDCALHHVPLRGRAGRLESWQNAEDQGAAAARSIAGAAAAPGRSHPWFWTDQFGLNIQMLGFPHAGDRVYRTGPEAEASAVYRTVDPRTGCLTSVVAFSNAHAIKAARDELLGTAAFDPSAFHADEITFDESLGKREDAIMIQDALAASKQYVWPAKGLTRVPDWVYTDEAVYQREIERIFHGRTWNYVALEAEVPAPGDFIRSNVGPTPVVVSRDEDGEIHVFENRCVHRAAEFCRELHGNAKEFVCPYHQWTYDLKGNLAGVPFRRGVSGKGGMPSDFDPAQHGLRRLAVTQHRGVVFASYCNDMESLADYLGPEILAEFEATFDGRRPKVLGYYRHSLPGNWKLYHENLKDPYHATLLHTFLVTFGLLVAGNKSLMLADATGRHGVMASAKSDTSKLTSDTKKEMRAYKEGMSLEEPRFMDFVDEFDSPWSVTMSTIWPNLIVQREMNTLGLRHIVPTGPNEFIMKWTMFGFEGDDEEMTRHRLRQGNLMGPAGFLGLEDNEAIKFVQDGMLNVPDGEHVVELDPDVIGTSDTLISEASIRAMYQHWREVMGL